MKIFFKSNNQSISKQLIKLSMPILLGMLSELLYLLSDTYFISIIDKSNPSIISGVGLIFPIVFLLTSVDQGIGTGISTITSIAKGGKDEETIKRTAITGFNLSFYFGLAMVILFFIFAAPIVNTLSGNGLTSFTKIVAIEYLRYSLPGFIFMFCVQARFSVFQGIGNTKTIGAAMVLSTILNMILDPILIFYFALGVKGAAIATVISQVCLWIYITYVYYKNNITKFKINNMITFDLALVKRILKLGIPASLSFIILSTWFMIINKFVSSISEVSMSAYTLVGRLNGVLVTPALAFAVGLSIMIGQSYGAKDMEKIKKVFVHGTFIITVFTGFLGILYMAISRLAFLAMSDNVEVISMALKQVYITTIPISIGTTVAVAASSSLQAIERPIKAMLVTAFRTLFISIPLIQILQLIFSKNVLQIWISVTIGVVCGGVIGIMWFLNELKNIEFDSIYT